MRWQYALLLVLLLPCRAGAANHTLIDSLTHSLNALVVGGAEVRDPALTQEFIQLSEQGRHSDVTILDLYTAVTLPDSTCARLVAEQRGDGTWPDIDYADTKRSCWSPADHLTRLVALTKVYKTPASAFAGSRALFATLHRAIDYWLAARPECPNWWYNQIGCPRMLFTALLLLKEELSQKSLHEATTLMAEPTFEMTGQNMAATAGNNLMRGLLLDDLALVSRSRDELLSVIYISLQEGIQHDFSFHQHGAQLQFGNYGLAYAATLSQWARVLAGTSLALPAESGKLLGDFILEGVQWSVFKGLMDVNACGRQVFQNAQRGKALSLSVSCLNMTRVDPSRAEAYTRYVRSTLQGERSAADLCGHKHYHRSDFTIHRNPHWYASVRMCSERIIGFETTNSENLQGIYSADGATLVSVHGDEYLDIFPIWNWYRLPGVTSPSEPMPKADKRPANRARFVGGVNDGHSGCTVMEINKPALKARKSYFFIANTLTCLGSGISSGAQCEVTTTLNQTHLRGEVTVDAHPLPANTVVEVDTVQWVHHDQMGYYFPTPSPISISNRTQSGDWRKIALFYASQPVSGEVFLLSLGHGTTPRNASYAYSLLPGRTPAQTAQFAAAPAIRILSNTPALQAVAAADQSCAQYVFYRAGSSELPGGIRFETRGACLLMAESTAQGKLTLHLADPTQRQRNFTLHIFGRMEADGASYNPRTGITKIAGTFPAAEGQAGASIAIHCRRH